MKKLILLFFIFTFNSLESEAQERKGSIKGQVKNRGKAIIFANIGLENTTFGTSSDANGNFELSDIPFGNYSLQVSAMGYESFGKTINIQNSSPLILDIELQEKLSELDEVVVTGTMKEVSRKKSPAPVEVFTPAYFKKNPTPALFEALQLVNGVRPQLNCNICNTGDIHINGMEGPYTMTLIDGMPIIGGLASVYGLNGIPNSMVERLEVVKGPASSLYGSEAVGGLINVITKSPDKAPIFTLDAYATDWQEFNTDVGFKNKIGKATSLFGLNYFNYGKPIDKNGDNFTDVTLQNRISLFNKWNFKRNSNRLASIAGRFIYEDRWGGEMQWTPEYRGGDQVYGESIYTTRYELLGAYQLPFQREKVIYNFSYSNHHQDSRYGNTSFIAQENIVFNQLNWDKKINDTHDLLVGAALRYTYYDDNTPATRVGASESSNEPAETLLPGIFLQDELTFNEHHKLLLGARLDHHSKHGEIFSPRLNYKWAPDPQNIFRLSLGNGFRVVNLFTEDHAATTGAREVVIAEELLPERSYNANLNYQKFIGKDFGLISLDATAFYTFFTNKIIADYETNDQQIIYDNLDGYAVSTGLSLNTDVDFATLPLEVNLGLTFMDVFEIRKEEGVKSKHKQLLTENFSGTYTVSYKIQKWDLTIDYTGNFYGPMKLPLLDDDFRDDYSPFFSIQNIQLTKRFSDQWTLYGGVKNLLNFTPSDDAIMRPFDPFDRNVDDKVSNPYGYTFDPTYVYASNQGIRAFLGLRFTLMERD
ncbi:TonB-dependent receptor [Xanthovirga aplysinae]|uniref:TonB-dependent receptor n=1 Tax=Xanthovirga aplysinae TaxID=2529853 RepID=UPI0012BC8517|nr:TonB-dependent receptor [Xanthovirga aplysinae]MTI30987.1 TonB-dependent receptor [Xanthovirga aplysinae]